MNGDNNPIEFEYDKLFGLAILLVVCFAGILFAIVGGLS